MTAAAQYLQQDQPDGVPPLALTGERTLPDVPAENYWYRRHLAVYEWIAARVRGQRVIDLACGEGRDTLELVRRGWRVVAIDQSRRGIDMLLDQLDVDHAVRVSPQIASFADARLVPCDLLNSSFAIPFCPRDQFDDLWRRIVSSIKPGGRFAGQLFGERDSWGRCGLTIPHTRAQVDHLFKDFTFERLEEDEKDDLAGQRPKHWHVFHIVARKMVP